MDGNGRWAEARGLPRAAGHREGVRALRALVEHCVRRELPALTVFAFSSENWKRPVGEVALLMELFLAALAEHVDALHENGVSVRFIGDRAGLSPDLRAAIGRAEGKTGGNRGLRLTVAANYGGRWDLVRTCREIAELAAARDLEPADIDETAIAGRMSLAGLADPDLFIRTGGERRISNFLLWELAYTELYFTDILWPEFGPAGLDEAIRWYGERERRFGQTSGQIERVPGA
jgi:undecaprenyl diphosphate synthase